MVEKEIKVKVSAETDIGDFERLEDVLDDAKSKGEDLGETLSQALEKANEEVESLTEQLAQIEMGEIDGDFDAVAQQLEEAEEKADALSQALSDLDNSGLDNSKDSAEQLGDELDNAKNKADDLSNSLDLIEAGALMSIANELSSLGANAEGMAQEMNTAAITVGQLATNVGMAEPQMVSLINTISNATFPQNEAMAYVNALNQMGVSADKLGSAATNMDRINDATGIGYQSVMQLTQGLRAVGVEADNLPSSFNAIAYAQANVNGGADTLSMVLKRQAATINEYGLNVDQLVVIMQKLSEQGVQGMKMGSELSKVLKDNNGDIKAIEQSLGLQTGALSNASTATGKYAGQLQKLADEEAEHKTWLDLLGAAWEDVSLSLSPVLSPMASFMGMIGQSTSWAVGVNALVQLAQATKVATAAQWLYNAAMAANPITIVIIAVLALVAALTYLYFTNEDVRAAIDGLGQSFIQAGQIIYDSIMWAIDAAISALQGLWDYITTLGGLLPSNVSITGNQIIDTVLRVMAFIATLPAQLGMIYINIIAKALGFGDNFSQNMITGASNAVNGFVTWITSLPSKLKEELDRMLEMAGNFALEIADKLSFGGASMVLGWITGSGEHSPGFMYDALVGELQAMVNAPLEFLADLPNNLAEIGALMIGALQEAFEGTVIGDMINETIGKLMAFHSAVVGVSEYIMSVGGLLSTNVDITGNAIIDGILRVIMFVATLPVQIGMYLTNTIAQALGFGSNFTQTMINAGINAVNNFLSQISKLPSGLANELSEMISDALNFAGRIGQILWDAGINAITNFLNALDRHSPGIMQREFIAEISEMGTRVPSEGRKLVSNMGRLGSDVVDSFNPELGNVKVGNVSGGVGSSIGSGDFTINIYGDVDSEKRINDIIDAITKAMAWDNKTAGRTS